ncbi:MAG: S-methyl-5-thioribose-1-phosphate isomerase [Bacteroidia bacterium]
MKIDGVHHRSISIRPDDPHTVWIIDQRHLPHHLVWEPLRTAKETAIAIEEMHVRGAPMIGVTAAYGLYLAALEIGNVADFDQRIREEAAMLNETRPTAVNLKWALDQQLLTLDAGGSVADKIARLLARAHTLADEDAETCRMIGVHGLELIKAISKKKSGAPVNILTHCNAGWLACVDYGTATSPMYQAFDAGIRIHVWVDETRPRNQGARLTAFELGQHGIPHTVIVDNAGGHLMQHGLVDLCIVGSDRTTITGDVANKIGTYLKALAAKDNGIPFYVALPSSTFDFSMRDGVNEIPIETRNPREVTWMDGKTADGRIEDVLLTPETSPAINFGFDVTPARLVSGLITERGICKANEKEIREMYPEIN